MEWISCDYNIKIKNKKIEAYMKISRILITCGKVMIGFYRRVNADLCVGMPRQIWRFKPYTLKINSGELSQKSKIHSRELSQKSDPFEGSLSQRFMTLTENMKIHSGKQSQKIYNLFGKVWVYILGSWARRFMTEKNNEPRFVMTWKFEENVNHFCVRYFK